MTNVNLFVTEQPSPYSSFSLAPSTPSTPVDSESLDDLLRSARDLFDSAKYIKVHSVQFEVNVVKSQLKELMFVASSRFEMAEKTFKIDVEYLQKRWRREYRHGYAFLSEIVAKEERDYDKVQDAIGKCELRVSKLEETLGD